MADSDDSDSLTAMILCTGRLSTFVQPKSFVRALLPILRAQ